MNLFENVKAVVTVRQAAEHYGLKVGARAIWPAAPSTMTTRPA